MILEDDMEILQWPSNRLIYAAPPGWGILQLYAIEWRHALTEDSAYTSTRQLWVPWGSGFGSTGAYLITRDGMRQVPTSDVVPLWCQCSLVCNAKCPTSTAQLHCCTAALSVIDVRSQAWSWLACTKIHDPSLYTVCTGEGPLCHAWAKCSLHMLSTLTCPIQLVFS